MFAYTDTVDLDTVSSHRHPLNETLKVMLYKVRIKLLIHADIANEHADVANEHADGTDPIFSILVSIFPLLR
jgi:hypothetical protein